MQDWLIWATADKGVWEGEGEGEGVRRMSRELGPRGRGRDEGCELGRLMVTAMVTMTKGWRLMG